MGKALGEQIGDAVSSDKAPRIDDAVCSTKPQHEPVSLSRVPIEPPVLLGLTQPGSKIDAPDLPVPTCPQARQIPKLTVTQPAPFRDCLSETPVATPNSCGTIAQQDRIIVSFTEEDKIRDKIMFLTPKVAGSDEQNEFVQWSFETKAWEPLCITPTTSRDSHTNLGPPAAPEMKNSAEKRDSPVSTEPSVAARVGQVLASYFSWLEGKR